MSQQQFRAMNHSGDVRVGVGAHEPDFGMFAAKDPKDLVGECLANEINAGKIEQHFLETVEARQYATSLRPRDQIVLCVLCQPNRNVSSRKRKIV